MSTSSTVNKEAIMRILDSVEATCTYDGENEQASHAIGLIRHDIMKLFEVKS